MEGPPPCLPTYVLRTVGLPLEICRYTMSFLLHPDTNLRHQLDMQRDGIVQRLDNVAYRLENAAHRPWNHDEEYFYLRAGHMVDRITRVVRKKSSHVSVCAVVAVVWMQKYPFSDLVQHITHLSACPEYMRELKIWHRNEWHTNFLRSTTHSHRRRAYATCGHDSENDAMWASTDDEAEENDAASVY